MEELALSLNIQKESPTAKFELDNRIINFSGEMNESSAKMIIEQLMMFNRLDQNKDILLKIDSAGGSMYSVMACIDAIHMIDCDVITFSNSIAMSAGQLLLMSGTKGKRFLSKNATIMCHMISGGAGGTLEEMNNSVQEAKRIQAFLENEFKENSKIEQKMLKKILSKDSFMTAEEAIKYGIADKIINKYSEIWELLDK